MKNVFKFACLFVVCLFVAFSFSSCDKDTCYECTLSGSETEEICEGDDDGSGGTISSDDLDAAVAVFISFGYDCQKK
jgi:hypothetical protein